jgi:hypothetical protein
LLHQHLQGTGPFRVRDIFGMEHLGVYLTMEIVLQHDPHECLAEYGIVHILFCRIAQDVDLYGMMHNSLLAVYNVLHQFSDL